jgi:gamma-glutamylcyclotransferase (GGCT)/AIG2-like uncharacterized protein YtfP
MSRWLVRRGRYLGPASTAGRLYDTGDYPALCPSSREDERVQGEVYSLPRPQPLLRRLDRFEGIGAGQPRPYEYRRERQRIVLADGACRMAWLYVYTLPVCRFRRIHSGDYLKFRRHGR